MQTRRAITAAACLLALATTAASADQPHFPDDREIEQIATGFQFTEGPALAPDGSIYFTDIPPSTIHRYDPEADQITVARQPSGGANGLMFDNDGRLLICEDRVNRRITRLDLDTGDLEVLASQYEGQPLNSPNDIDHDDHGGFYFTDPRYGDRDSMALDVEAVYYVDADGEISQLITDLHRPNGVLVSRDFTTLYVADEPEAVVYAYDILAPGEISNRRIAGELDPDGGPWGPDGLTEDAHGNLYAAGQAAVWAWDPDTAERLLHVPMPEPCANLTFADDDRTLYVTASTSFYRLQLDFPSDAE